MAYDARLAERVRQVLRDRSGVREVTMFGGLALMLDDRMVVCVSSGGGDLLVRVAPERDAELVSRPGARRAEMGRSRSMGEGWIAVDQAALESEHDLRQWVDAALDLHAQGSGARTTRSARKRSRARRTEASGSAAATGQGTHDDRVT